MSRPVITVENLSKAYRIGLKEEIPDSLVQLATSWVTAPVRNWRQLKRLNTFTDRNAGGSPAEEEHEDDLFWALQDVTFTVAQGEVVGIIGHNGAGKSTLLKILSRITEPTSGCARLRGRVSSLLEVGTGFHPELSGRENIYMNGTILGMTRREIDRKFDEIVDFSGVERFLDTPVKRYSSGMSVRLAFAVAAHLEPEILIIDEVLAVGDVEFQNKCLGKMEDVASSGRTVLFVSHNMAAMESLCTRAVLLGHGRVIADGDVSNVIDKYLAKGTSAATDVDLREHPDRVAGSQSILRQIRIVGDDGTVLPAVRVGGNATFEVRVESSECIPQMRLLIEICSPRGDRLFTLANHVQHGVNVDLQGELTMRARLQNCRLFPGEYPLRLLVKSQWNKLDQILGGLSLHVVAGDDPALARLPGANHWLMAPEVEWSLDDSSPHTSRRR